MVPKSVYLCAKQHSGTDYGINYFRLKLMVYARLNHVLWDASMASA